VATDKVKANFEERTFLKNFENMIIASHKFAQNLKFVKNIFVA
jgi:hypothetical protein